MLGSRIVVLTSLLLLSLCATLLLAQTTNATITGFITDQSKAIIPGIKVEVINTDTSLHYVSMTNSEGSYTVTGLPPGNYKIQVEKPGFKAIVKPDVILHVQDVVAINFTMAVGSVSESITVEGGAPLVNTESATVSTVVDRQFAENLPMNGRSFQTLIELTPGVVATAVNGGDGGQFSVNGQRPSSNYWMVDGVSANIGVSASFLPGNGVGGALGSFSALGGTNSLVSVDAMQEFRIQTSTFAPEFGRTPGAQISIVTRSGTNQVHGTAFDYLRNDLFDANDWFAAYAGLTKPEERQNDFGGTFSGPIIKDRTFFFFSYEGLRLRLPQVVLDTVPDLSARQSAVPAMQPYLNAFPFDPNQPDLGNGLAQYRASYSNSATLDAYSLRIDHRLGDKWALFGRYNHSPSEISDRGASDEALSVVTPIRVTTETATLGATWAKSALLANDLRLNYSHVNGSSSAYMDSFGGAVPFTTVPFPSPFSVQNAEFELVLFALTGGQLVSAGRIQRTVQRQFNIVDSLAIQKGRHSLKFGVDFRRLSPVVDFPLYAQFPLFFDMPSAENATPTLTEVESNAATTFLFHNLGLYAQDTWRAGPRLTLTYGARWDVDFAPSTLNGPNLPAVIGYNLNDLSNLALAPAGSAPFGTQFTNVAPRFGLAYELSQNANWQTVFRGGFGVFYDLASSEVGNLIANSSYPFSALNIITTGAFPLDAASAAPPAITASSLACCGNVLTAFDPHLQLPYTLQWNAALEQGLGTQQSLSASYVGSSGKRLLQTTYVLSPNPNLYSAELVGNKATSDYNALQLRFQRRLSNGLQALASYTWSHSIDDGSAGSSVLGSNTYVPALGARANRGPSDFDIRNALSLGATYDVFAPRSNVIANAIVRGWSAENFVIARSAPPVDVFYDTFEQGALFNARTNVRPDAVPSQPLYLYGAGCVAVLGPPCAGGKGFNPAAFTSPPLDPNTGNPVRQGDLGRNALRGFGAVQWDFAIHREFPIHDRVKLQFRAEFFNVLNHPNFAPPVGDLRSPQALNPQFGQSAQMLGQYLSGGGNPGTVGNGAFNPLYQLGGPRSIQFALKLTF
jgi:hypothetical protein